MQKSCKTNNNTKIKRNSKIILNIKIKFETIHEHDKMNKE